MSISKRVLSIMRIMAYKTCQKLRVRALKPCTAKDQDSFSLPRTGESCTVRASIARHADLACLRVSLL